MKPPSQAPQPSRRKLLRALMGVAPAASLAPAIGAGSVGLAVSQPVRASIKTQAHVVVAGSGLAGLAVAYRLRRLLDGARITLVDAKREHNYQPGYTLVATGIWPVSKVQDRNADLVPAGVDWVQEAVAEFDPAANNLVTASGRRIPYDYLVVATGCHLDYAAIEGMDVSAIGRNGLASVYASAQAAQDTWQAMQAFVDKGGKAVMTLPPTAIKCAGAPLKMTFLLRDRLREAGALDRAKIDFHSSLKVVFGVPVVNANILERWSAMNIQVNYESRLAAVDIGAQRATFVSAGGAERTEVPYDFLHVVPPMRAPDAVLNSDLAWKEGPFSGGGWLEVDKDTLQHRRYPNVFGVGDVNGTPRGKTAATVKKSAPIVAHNLTEVIAGRKPNLTFDGYTSCPMITREGSAMLLEFDYAGNLVPSLPAIDPMQDSYLAWLLKYRFLKPAYMATLKGRV